MPTGIILASASSDTKEDSLKKVFEANGLEPEKVEAEVVPEPQRDAFESEEEFETAHTAWQEQQPPPAKEETEDEEEEEVAPRRPSKFQKRISKITSRLEQENKELKDRLAAIEGKKSPEPEKVEDKNPRPVRDKFKSAEEYEDALIAWGAEKHIQERDAKAAREAADAEAKENYTEYCEGVDEFKDKHEDWDDLVKNNETPMHPDVQYAIFEMRRDGAEVIYYLAKHPDYALKLAEMPVRSAVMEVGRLSAKLKAASGSPGSGSGSGAQEKPKPKVPVPIRPLNSPASSSSLTSREIAAKPNYPGKLKDYKTALRAGR